MDGNVTYPRESMLQAKLALIIMTALVFTMLGFFLICHVLSISSLRSGELMKKTNRWRIYLFMSCFCGFLSNTLVAVSVWLDWSFAVSSCTLIPSFLTMFFVNMRQFSGLVLYSRATVVHDGLRLKNSNLLIFREFLWYSITFGVWIIFGWSFWVNYLGKVVPEGICVLYSRFPAVILTFAIMDALMTIAMLMLFVVPLTAHTREMAGMLAERNNNVSDKLKRIIKYNFTVSMVLATLDTLGLTGMTILLMIVDGDVVDPTLEYLQVWALVPPLIAAFCSFIGLHSMTWSWVPGRVRLWFNRSEFSANELESSSAANRQGTAEVVYLGNLHADGRTIETQILVRHYVVPFDTMCSRIFGLRTAKWIASQYRYVWRWRVLLTCFFFGLEVVGILVLKGLLPAWVSWPVFVFMLLLIVTDNNYSIATLKLLSKRFGPVVRLLFSFALMFFLFDVVNWDQRCAIVVTIFLGMQYAYFTDALVRESRECFLSIVYLLSMPIAFWLLLLLQGDFIAGRHNTIIVFETVQRYEYSVYLAARDFTFLMCVFTFKDIVNVGRGKGRRWFLFLTGDVAVKVVGLGSGQTKSQKLTTKALVIGESSVLSAGAEASIDAAPSADPGKSPTTFMNRFSDLLPSFGGSIKGRVTSKGSSDNTDHNSQHDAGSFAERERPEVVVNTIELRERDSLVVRLFGVKTGAKLLQIYTEPWFRLVNEWLLGFPLAFYVCAILPGFVDPALSLLFFLSILPFLRNFGLKSAMLLKLLMFRVDFLIEMTLVITGITICVITFQDTLKAILGYYLAVFWLDIRTNDARCVFFHTGTRRGRRLSPFERFLFRAASVQIAGGFIALPIMLFLGITLNTDFYRGFQFVSDGTSYPNNLDQVFFYEMGANGIWTVVWKLILDVYVDLYRRGKGVHLRYIRAPIAPRFSEGSSTGASGSSQRPTSKNYGNSSTIGFVETKDGFAMSYHESTVQPVQRLGSTLGEVVVNNPMMVAKADTSANVEEQ